MTKTKTEPQGIAEIVGEASAAIAASQALGLSVLLSEMKALAQLMPGQDDARAADEIEEHEREVTAATEAAFDNLPV